MVVQLVQEGGFPAGEVIIAGAAITAAVLAAWTAERRLKITLAAQQKQHRAELTHDREMRDLEEMRRTLDDVSSHLALVRRRAQRFLAAVKEEDENTWKPSRAISETFEQLQLETAAVRERYERLVLRLGSEDALAICAELVDLGAAHIAGISADLRDPDRRPNAITEIEDMIGASAYFAGMFGGIARARFASQFSDEENPARFLKMLREGLEEEDRKTALLLLDSLESIEDNSQERQGEQEGAKDAQGEASGEEESRPDSSLRSRSEL